MPNALDLQLVPLHRQGGQEIPSLPGLLTMMPPRRTARGREQDRLIVYLTLTGNTTFSTAEYLQLTSQVAAQFYQTAGSLTSAMRAGADALNNALLERNLRTTGRGQFVIGWLVMGALRGAQMFLLLSGPTHVMGLHEGQVRHLHDPALSGRGLGLSQTLTIYFAQAELQSGDHLLFCGQCPPAWEAVLTSRETGTVDVLRRRLLAAAEAEVSAALIQVQGGRGQVTVLKLGRPEATPVEPHAEERTLVPTGSTNLPPPKEIQAAPPSSIPPGVSPSERLPQPSAYALPPQRADFPTPVIPPPVVQKPAITEEEPEELPISEIKVRNRRGPSEQTRRAARTAVNGMQAWRRITEKIGLGFQKLLPRLLPGNDPQTPVRLPAWWMAFVAIATALVIGTIGSVVFIRFGKGELYAQYYNQAQTEALRAASESDPVRQREAWQQTLYLLDQTELHRETSETQDLRQQAQGSLDALLGIIRLDFQPAINGGLGRGVRIIRMASTDTDLYMLDAESGNILRAFLTGGGYQLDHAFQCKSKQQYGGYQVGALVDIFTPPKINSANATVIGIDGNGNLLYCAPNQDPKAVPLPPPDTNWGQVTAVSFENSTLNVLDANANAVWIYLGKDVIFEERPLLFFDKQIPALGDTIDLASNGDDLYLLHEDSHLTKCAYGRFNEVPTRCDDPATLVDPHPANQGIGSFQDVHFTQIFFASPPDSTVLLLDNQAQVTYRFSPRSLELQNQMRSRPGSDTLLPSGPVSAMTMSPNHVLFLAFEDEVYFAANVP